MATLNELLVIANSIETQLIETDGHLTPEIEAQLNANELDIKRKIDAYGMVVESLKSRRAMATDRMKQWEKVVNATEVAEENLKARLRYALNALNALEAHGMEFTIKVQANPPKVALTNETAIPGRYLITETLTKVDKRKILEDLKSGVSIDGACLERTDRVVIKTSARKELT